MKYLITLALCLSFTFVVNAQTSCMRIINARGKMTGFTNAHADLKKDFSCSKDTFKAKFVSFYYGDDDRETTAYGFWVRLANSRKVMLSFEEEEETSCLSLAEKSLYESFFVVSQTYTWTVWRCGAGGNSDPFLFSVKK